MKIVIAPQAFKGCASAHVIASTIAAGVHRAFPNAHLVLAPVADGGDGTLEILLASKSGERRHAKITGALNETKSVYWGVLTNAFPKTAIIESARVCGLASLEKQSINPLITTTYGVGSLIGHALDQGYRRFFVGLGGSATNDAGAGLAQALGVRFLDAKGKQLPVGGGALIHLKHIDVSQINPRVKEAEINAGCDVNNPLMGTLGASLVYSPQKGATKKMAQQLEDALGNFATIVKNDLGIDIFKLPYLGAAGGMAAGLYLFCHAKLVSGAEWILSEINFDRIIDKADLVITGEGCLDNQTFFQKAPFMVAQAAKRNGVPVIMIAGTIVDGTEKAMKKEVDAFFAVSEGTKQIPLNALPLLQKCSEESVKAFLAGAKEK